MPRSRKRSVAVVAGIGLVLVPTLFTVFPAWATWPILAKLVLIAAWLIAAVVVVHAGAIQGEQVEELVGRVRARRDKGRVAAGRFILREILRPEAAGFPAHYEFRLFLPDASGQRLVPEYESAGQAPSEGWNIGQGATGQAWASQAYVRVHGPEVADGTYGLTVEQQQRYRDLQVVAAAPVLNARIEPIAVLSVSSKSDDGFLFGGDGPQRHAELAEVVARVLIDIFRVGGD